MSNDLNEYPSIHWKKFFDRFSEIEEKPLLEWDANNILSYFCKRYKEHYKLDYTFKFNSTSPSKSFEVFQIKKLSMNLSKDPLILKNYIDWWFENKIILKKKRITSMAFLSEANVVNEYKFKVQLSSSNGKIERSTLIPENYKQIIDKHQIEIKTYGDLSFVKKIIDDGGAAIEHENMIKDLVLNGFDLTILDKVK